MEEDFVNNSGQGKGIEIPAEVKRFNWGAFFLTWIWGLFNKSYLTIIILALGVLSYVITFVMSIFVGLFGESDIVYLLFIIVAIINIVSIFACLGLSIWFGIKGNDWAWQNKKWNSLNHFHDVQRIWAIVGVILIGLFVGLIALLTIPTLLMNTSNVKNRASVLRTVSLIQQSSLMNEALEAKCELTSNGLAICFNKMLNRQVDANRIKDDTSDMIIEFTGDGVCADSNACYVTVINAGSNERIGLYLDNGIVKVNSEDVNKVKEKYSASK